MNGPSAGWQRYRRRGVVTAEQRAERWTWTTDSGEVMTAEPGDWAVIDDTGRERSVSAAIFESTHEKVGPHHYRRTGTVLARPARPGEVIGTLEGSAVAQPGDWIVQGENREQWPTPSVHFATTYEGPLDP